MEITENKSETVCTQPKASISELLDEDKSLNIKTEHMHRFSIAPMLDVTNVHFRFLMRLLTRYSTLWTEMIHANTLNYNNEHRANILRFNPIEHPVVLQLGGSEAAKLADAGLMAEKEGYDEVNINCGCPSPKVQDGCFGAVLMKDPMKVAECLKAMRAKMTIPCHVKCRIGVDDDDSYDFVKTFVRVVSNEGGCGHFIIHSRKCILKGLSPADNRKIPPLKYEVVKQLKVDFPHVDFSINGGINTYEMVEDFLRPETGIQGVMVGRVAYENPWFLCDIDRRVYGKPNPGHSRREILAIWGDYCDKEVDRNPVLPWPNLTKPIINLFANQSHGAVYRRALSERDNYKECKQFSDLVKLAVKEMEKYNLTSLDEKPPV